MQHPGVEERVDVFGPEEVDVVPPLVGHRVVVEQVGQLRQGALVVLQSFKRFRGFVNYHAGRAWLLIARIRTSLEQTQSFSPQ